jgi:hypothetical protein
MRQQLPVFAAIVTAAALVVACSGGGGDAPTEPVAAAQNTLTIALANIQAIQDCDGIEGDGDFTFTVFAYLENKSHTKIYEASPNLAPGARHTVARTSTYVIPASDGDTFLRVRFQGTEWDKSILGTTYADDRLAGELAEKQHTYANGTWSELGVQTITLGTATPNDCLVRLTYTATASKS